MLPTDNQLDLNNEEFQTAFELIKETNCPIFLTGKAGTGKSTFLRYISSHTKKSHVIVAPTGIAALNVGGQTIHSFFQLPLGPILPKDERIMHIKLNPNKRKLVQKMELLIIDEVSMVRADLMDAIDFFLRYWRQDPTPFGGVQLMLVGDMFQLEPVTTRDDWEGLKNHYTSPYFFNSLVAKQIDLISIELLKIYRQHDKYFINLLNRVRDNTADWDDMEMINQRLVELSEFEEDEKIFITLSTTRNKADIINKQRLAALEAEPLTFNGEIQGSYPLNKLPTDLDLKLKIGAQIMFVKNDLNGRRYMNGTLGIIDSLEHDGIKVRLQNESIIKVGKYISENAQYKYDPAEGRIKEVVIGKFTQYPIRLAWAVTIHKSQGLTFENIYIDTDKGAFAGGQIYVALSRCTSLEGIILRTPIRRQDIITNQQVIEFYEDVNNFGKIKEALGLDY